MKIRNRNGRSHAVFSTLDTKPSPLGSTTLHSLSFPLALFFWFEINPLDKYCPGVLRPIRDDRGREGFRPPLPPNRTGGFPAYGSPVAGFLIVNVSRVQALLPG